MTEEERGGKKRRVEPRKTGEERKGNKRREGERGGKRSVGQKERERE